MTRATEYKERADEVGLNLTVVSAAERTQLCPGCHERRIVFHCHVFRERKVEDRCKACAIERAGGEEKIFVKTAAKERWSEGPRRVRDTSGLERYRNAADSTSKIERGAIQPPAATIISRPPKGPLKTGAAR